MATTEHLPELLRKAQHALRGVAPKPVRKALKQARKLLECLGDLKATDKNDVVLIAAGQHEPPDSGYQWGDPTWFSTAPIVGAHHSGNSLHEVLYRSVDSILQDTRKPGSQSQLDSMTRYESLSFIRRFASYAEKADVRRVEIGHRVATGRYVHHAEWLEFNNPELMKATSTSSSTVIGTARHSVGKGEAVTIDITGKVVQASDYVGAFGVSTPCATPVAIYESSVPFCKVAAADDGGHPVESEQEKP
jgi:hypothetical protein